MYYPYIVSTERLIHLLFTIVCNRNYRFKKYTFRNTPK